MDYRLLTPSDYLGAVDLGGKDVTVTIEAVGLVEVFDQRKNKKKMRGVLTFKSAKKQMVLNKTNRDSIRNLHGKDTDQWIGKQITLYPTTCKVGGVEQDCIRVR